ncbi:MAG: hypothetical protein R2749_09330 [Acidimicrobiales bacterium]
MTLLLCRRQAGESEHNNWRTDKESDSCCGDIYDCRIDEVHPPLYIIQYENRSGEQANDEETDGYCVREYLLLSR